MTRAQAQAAGEAQQAGAARRGVTSVTSEMASLGRPPHYYQYS